MDVTPKEAGVSEVPEMAMATSNKTETQASTVIGGEITITGKIIGHPLIVVREILGFI